MKKEKEAKLKGSLLIGFAGFILNLFINFYDLIHTQRTLLSKLAITLPTAIFVFIICFIFAFISISAYQMFYDKK